MRGMRTAGRGMVGRSPIVITFAPDGREQTELIASGTDSAVVIFANLKRGQ